MAVLAAAAPVARQRGLPWFPPNLSEVTGTGGTRRCHRLPHGSRSTSDVLDVGDGFLPCRVRTGLALFDGDQRVADGVSELAGVRAQRLVLDVLGGVREDLADRRVVEE